jgi:hypothetical protein
MILLKILEHDLHRAREQGLVPLLIEVPAIPDFLPALVSSSRGQFLVSRRLTGTGHVRVGVFSYDSDRVDDVLLSMTNAAYELSRDEGWPNVMSGRGPARAGFDYIREQCPTPGQPHVCLTPQSWTQTESSRFFGARNLDANRRKYRKHCRIVPAKVAMPTFLSRPDMVGMYTQFMGGRTSILLHNVRRGMAFCPPGEGS